MISSTPWDDIQRPDADYNVRLTEESGPIATYWGKDVSGHCLFVTELEGDHLAALRAADLNIHGITVDLRQRLGKSEQTLVLTLVSHADRDLFHALCSTLARNLSHARNAEVAITVTLNHLKRWQRFLAGKKPRLLSSEEVRGLFAELHFLRTLQSARLSWSDAVDAWAGPEGGDQDFAFGDTAVEVKALSNKTPNIVRIASEDQLESLAERLFLVVQRIVQDSESSGAFSLNEMIRFIEEALRGSSVLDKYQAKLAMTGYVEVYQYDSPSFQVAETSAHCVDGAFPRIIRSGMPNGIHRVRYQLHLDAVKPFKCPLETIWETNT